MKTLQLTLKKKWFDMIKSGEKKEEYREIKPYWIKRLISDDFNWDCETSIKRNVHYIACPNGFYKKYDTVTFKNGYAKDAPVITCELISIARGEAVPEWSDNWQREVFIIKLGKIIS